MTVPVRLAVRDRETGRVKLVDVEGIPVPHADPDSEYDGDTDISLWGFDFETEQPTLVISFPFRVSLSEDYDAADAEVLLVADAREVFMGYVENWRWLDGEEGRTVVEKLFRDMADLLAEDKEENTMNKCVNVPEEDLP